MKRLLCDPLPTTGRNVELPADENRHALQVLRMASGVELLAIDGQGTEILARLNVTGKKGSLEFLKTLRTSSHLRTTELVLEAAILKTDAMGWVVEKAVELGASRLVPIESEYVVVKVKDKGPEAFQERWQRIADQSLKQCGRLWALKVEAPISLEELASRANRNEPQVRFVLDERQNFQQAERLFLAQLEALDLSTISAIRILVGPEGGWGDRDRRVLSTLPSRPVHLGETVLRAETAALASLAQASAVLERSFLDKNRGQGGI